MGLFNFLKHKNILQFLVMLILLQQVYPLIGKCLLTGPEYLLANNKGCQFKVKSAFYIPNKSKVRRLVECK